MTELTNGARFERLVEIMRILRAPGGCPWDRDQTFQTIAPYTIEEAYEVADAIANGTRAELCEELGDLLLQSVYHAQLAAEEGSFDDEGAEREFLDRRQRRQTRQASKPAFSAAKSRSRPMKTSRERRASSAFHTR